MSEAIEHCNDLSIVLGGQIVDTNVCPLCKSPIAAEGNHCYSWSVKYACGCEIGGSMHGTCYFRKRCDIKLKE